MFDCGFMKDINWFRYRKVPPSGGAGSTILCLSGTVVTVKSMIVASRIASADRVEESVFI